MSSRTSEFNEGVFDFESGVDCSAAGWQAVEGLRSGVARHRPGELSLDYLTRANVLHLFNDIMIDSQRVSARAAHTAQGQFSSLVDPKSCC